MKFLAIVRATDIFKLRSKLLEMNHAGLSFEGKPKEINQASIEKILSLDPPCEKYEVCVLVSLAGDCVPLISDVIILDDSHKFFKYFAKMMTILPDFTIPRRYTDINKQPEITAKTSKVYLGVFVNRKVQVQTVSDSVHTGILKHADSIGVFFEPSDDSDPLFITWHDIKKIIIPKEEKK